MWIKSTASLLYRRCGVVDLFVAFESLAYNRMVKLTNTRTAIDFAHFLCELVDVHYNHCEKIVLVMDFRFSYFDAKQPSIGSQFATHRISPPGLSLLALVSDLDLS